MIHYRCLFDNIFLHWLKNVQVESGSGRICKLIGLLDPHRLRIHNTDILYRQDIEWRLVQVWLRERKHCNLCDVVIDSIRLAKIHFNSRLHREAAGQPVINDIFLSSLFLSFPVFLYVSVVLHISGVSFRKN
jgi:hypothetical protein